MGFLKSRFLQILGCQKPFPYLGRLQQAFVCLCIPRWLDLLAWGVPRATHTYLVQQCLAPGATSARAEVLARFAGFYNGLRNSPSPEVRTVALLCGRDLRTTTGSNIRVVEEASGLSVWTSTTAQVRRAVRQKETVTVPPGDYWRLPYLRRLLEQRLQYHYRGDKEQESRVQSLIDSLCVN